MSEIQTDRSVEFIICVQLKRIGFRAGSISRYESNKWFDWNSLFQRAWTNDFLHDIYIWPHKLAECALARIQCVWSDLNCFMKRAKIISSYEICNLNIFFYAPADLESAMCARRTYTHYQIVIPFIVHTLRSHYILSIRKM